MEISRFRLDRNHVVVKPRRDIGPAFIFNWLERFRNLWLHKSTPPTFLQMEHAAESLDYNLSELVKLSGNLSEHRQRSVMYSLMIRTSKLLEHIRSEIVDECHQ